MGDGFLATFDGPARAIRCATSIRDELAQIGVTVRAGIHTGELETIGSDVGGMVVEMGGKGRDGSPLHLRWWLVADAGHGPEVPVTPAVVLAGELADGRLITRGAQPCMGLLGLEQIEAGFSGYALRTGVEVIG